MLGKIFKYLFLFGLIISLITIIFPSNAEINDYVGEYSLPKDDINLSKDTIKGAKLKFPLPKKNVNPLQNNDNSPLYGSDPSNIQTEIEYDPETNDYIFKRKLGDIDLDPPYSLGFDEYKNYNFDKAMKSYWKQRSKGDASDQRPGLIPKLEVGGEIFDRIFGGNIIDIRPQGYAELSFGINHNRTHNPAQPIRAQRQTIFDFNIKIQMNVVGQIGEKMKVTLKHDTEGFDFENAVKLEYTGYEDEIIQKIEAGNVSLPLPGTLITGSQSLFGFKTETKFGRLTLTSIFSQQKGESSTIELEGGQQTKEFEFKADQYEANKHFFLSHFFKEQYDEALSMLPIVKSGININRIEVWITNKSGAFDDSRNLIAFADLAESNTDLIQSSYVKNNGAINQTLNPHDDLNILSTIDQLTGGGVRDINQVTNALNSYGFQGGVDYEKIESARLLKPNEYTLNTRLGYISLNSSIRADQVLAVAFEYTLAGEVYRVGDFSNSAITAPQALIVKMLKGTSFSPQIKTWGLMMKNIYNSGAYQMSSEDFICDIFYNNDKTGTEINFLPVGNVDSTRLISVLNLDNLNKQQDPYPDGIFDFIEDLTVNSKTGKIIFPVLEPFGSYLKKKITNGDSSLDEIADTYVFQELYDSTQSKAKQIAEKNKYSLKGRYKSSGGSEIVLNAMNIPQGSVKVTSGAVLLTENVDYTVDYNLGRVKIINQGILESGTPIKIDLESNSLMNMQTKTLIGTHADYEFSKNFNIGATILHHSEKPMVKKVSIGDEPVSNTIWGFNTSYRTDAPFLTKAIDFIPFIETKEMSTITMTGEFAHLIPGHSRAIEREGNAYIDDFEGSKTSVDLKSHVAWSLSSTPADLSLFPESKLINDLSYGYNRAKVAWYVIDQYFHQNNSPVDVKDRSNHYVRQVYERELFPNKDAPTSQPTNLAALNVVFYPRERGPYNYDADNIDQDGFLLNPEKRWGGITRALQTTDFEDSNIEYIEFWLMDPFVHNDENAGGDLYFNLGDISEDILKDGRKSFEQGLPSPKNANPVDTTAWGLVPLMQSLINVFDADPETRLAQDVGLDGFNDENERAFFSSKEGKHDYLDKILQTFGEQSGAYKKAYADPSSDNFHHFRGSDYDEEKKDILDRYKNFNGHEGNSKPVEFSNESYATSGQVAPNIEDINFDNTLNENDNYFQYKVSLRKNDLQVGTNYITDKIETSVEFEDDKVGKVSWYQFKIPIYDYDKRIGAIQDFKSIRFFRMFMTKFTDTTVLRFAKMSLVRSEWRKYNASFMQAGEYLVDELSQTPFDVGAVNIEENGSREPINYILPPGIGREVDPANPRATRLNEQSMSLKVLELQDGDARAVYKNVGLDVRKYKTLKMFIHAESVPGQDELKDDDLNVFVRLGTDYKNNYYEFEIPLAVTMPGFYDGSLNDEAPDRYIVWPEENNLDLNFEVLQDLKQDRNDRMRGGDPNVSLTRLFTGFEGKAKVSVMGNPNLANVQTIMIGVRNPKKLSASSADDGLPKSGEIWVNELRLSNFDEKGGWAANARVTAKLADFGSVTLAGSTSKPGFGAINQKVSQRQKEEVNRFDISSNFELGKFFPEKWNVRVPLYIAYSQNVKNPEYDPLNPDIPFKSTMRNKNISKHVKDSIKLLSQDFSMRKSINLTNVKVEKNEGTPKVYDISNFSVSYGYNETFRRDVNTIFNTTKSYVGSFFYNYNATPRVVEPFKDMKMFNHRSLQIIKDFNFYYLPSQMSFRTSMNKSYGETLQRNIYDSSLPLPVNVQKNFIWIRQYDFNYNISRNLKLEFSATNNARIDEPQGRIMRDDQEYKTKRDTLINSLKNFGRNTQYNQSFNLTYTLPINKIPIFNWISTNMNYLGTYSWTVAPITPKEIKIGNTLQNGNSMSVNTNFTLTSLYSKVGYLNNLNKKYRGRQQSQKKQEEVVTYETKLTKLKADKETIISHKLRTSNISLKVTDADGKQLIGETRVIDDNKVSYTLDEDVDNVIVLVTGTREKSESIFRKIVDHTVLTLMSVRTVSVVLNDVNGTLLPGYMPKTQFMGMSSYLADPDMYGPASSITTPTYPFIFGWQEDNFGEWAINNNVVSRDTSNIQPFVQTHSRNWNVRAVIEPVRDFKIDVNWVHSFSKNSNNFYRYGFDANAGVNQFMKMNPSETGRFSMSLITILTAFEPINNKGEYGSKNFESFSDNRLVIATRLAQQRSDYDGQVDSDGFPSGFGASSQDVLIPAFLSAYTKISPSKIWLDAFPSLLKAMPNWKISYNGLAKIPAVKKVFRSINITHSYRCTYNVGSYMSRLSNEYIEGDDGLNIVRDELSNFYSKYQINGINIDERLVPLIAFDMKMNNSFDFKVEMKKERRLNMSFSNLQLSEEKRNEFLVGAGYRIKDVEIAIKTKGQQRNFKSDLNLRLDFSIRNSKVLMHKLQEGFHQPTDGQLLYTIKATADYVLSNRFNVTVFYDHSIVKPTIQKSYPKRDVRFGLRLRFTLAS